MEFKLSKSSINVITLISFVTIAFAIPSNTLAQEYPQMESGTSTTPNPSSITLPGAVAPTTAAKPDQEKAAVKICGDKPTCEISVKSGIDFLNYLKMCHSLEGATITWKASDYINVSLSADKEEYCSLKVENSLIADKPTTTVCKLNREQISGMTTPLAVTAVKNYEKSTLEVSKLTEVMKPITDCIGTLPTIETRVPVNPKTSTPSTPTNEQP